VEHSNSGILNDTRHEPDALSAQMQEWLTAAEARPSGPASSSDAERNPSDPYIGTVRDRSDFAPTRAASFGVSPRLRGVKSDQFTLKRPSRGKRMFRALARFVLAALLGVGATLGWQFHGEEAKQIVNAWAPSLSWLVAALPTNSPRELGTERDASASAGQYSMQVPTLPRSAPVAQSASAAATSELVPRLEEMARDLAAVRRGLEELAIKQERLEELAIKQEQMSQRMASLEVAEQDIRQKMSTSAPSRVVPVPQRKNAPNPTPPQAAQSSPLPAVPLSGQVAPARAPIPVR
jgi:hypothetical protein